MSNQLATRTTDLRTLVQSDKVREQLATALPSYYTPEQFGTIVRTALNRNPKLQDCTPESFMVALLTAAQMGIVPDGRNGHLLPRNRKDRDGKWFSECQFQADYKGLVGLVRRNPNVTDIYAEYVCERDTIKVTKGLRRDLVHEVDIKAARGDKIGAYAVLIYKDGTTSFEYLTREEIEQIRESSESWKAHKAKGYDTPWLTAEGEMWKKTAIRRLLKLADLSPETHDRMALDVDTTVVPTGPPEPPRISQPKFEQLPDRPADIPTSPAPEPEPEAEPEPEPEPAKEPVKPEPATRRTTRQAKAREVTPEKEPSPAPPEKAKEPDPAKPEPAETNAPDDDGPSGRMRSRLAEHGFTEAELIRVAINNRWCEPCDPGTPLEKAIQPEFIETFIEDFDTVREEIEELRNIGKKG